jgi:radial spoke head protein 9
MELHNLHRAGSMASSCLSPEEHAGLETGMMQRLLEENLSGKMYFWGKVTGTTQDYMIVYNLDPFAEFPTKSYYFCNGGDFVLRAMPALKPEYIEQADKIKTAFTGDPSFFAYNGDEEADGDEDPEAPPVERFREMHRLARTVAKIDHDCALVPRGALSVSATKKVIENKFYEGLSFQTASEARAYMHLRYPEQLQGIALLKKPGIVKSGDFLDCIDKDLPSGIWTIKFDKSNTLSLIANLYWPGYFFYTVIGQPEFGGCYFGNGLPMYDIAFML